MHPLALGTALGTLLAAGGVLPGGPPAEPVVLVKGGAGRLRVSDGGTSRVGQSAVVFLHGLGGDLECWRSQLDHVRASRRALAWDLRGHGGSDPAPGDAYTIDALAEDVEAVRQALGLGRLVLVGHSLAGPVLTTFAAAHPEAVAGLVYVDAVGDYAAYPRARLQPILEREAAPAFGSAARRATFEELLGPGARPETRARVLAALDRIDPPAFAALRRSMFGFVAGDRLAAWRGPALAVEAAGEASPAMASRVLHLPRTEVAGASHWVQLDAPDAVNRALDAFLAALP
jgi:pimeloyl-ACP methyl ester carboxylesterase